MIDLIMLGLLLLPNAVLLFLGVLMLARKTAPTDRGCCCRSHGSNPPPPPSPPN